MLQQLIDGGKNLYAGCGTNTSNWTSHNYLLL